MKELLKKDFNISLEIINFCESALSDIKPQINLIKDVVRYNQLKVLSAFSKNKISSQHLDGTTGYGYDDAGREAIDMLYSDVFKAEDALVRHNIISGTHAISICMFAVLRPGDTLVSATGKPYDTLDEVIDGGHTDSGSLKDFKIKYEQAELNAGKVSLDNIMSTLDEKTKMVFIQKSKGYDWRSSLTNVEIGEIIKNVKNYNKDIVCLVDNCYGEFTEKSEPTEYGADLVAGSLIKNPGGGLAPTGGYVVGKKELVELAAYKLNSVGLGKNVGATLDINRHMMQGFFMAPHIVGEALTAALFCGSVFKKMGFDVCPGVDEYRSDIIQAIKFKTPERVIEFCAGIQKGSPIDSFVSPMPWEMPGYSHKVIMAAGGFVQGSSIEISADAPIKPPYIAYMQGGLTFESAYAAIALALQNLADKKLIKGF
ncbi:MAG: methionine gamma-lyase family protein [Firmicutes bacterium]|nr:methionine gamma-lyase family protein [Bacillota bacterium]